MASPPRPRHHTRRLRRPVITTAMQFQSCHHRGFLSALVSPLSPPESSDGPDYHRTMSQDTEGTTDVLDRELEKLLNEEQVEDGDHDRYSHYVKKDKILKSALSGKPVIALCGKVWVPGRDPEKFPVCPTCKEIYETLRDE